MFFLQPCMLKNIGNMGRGTARPDGPIDPSLVQLRRDRAFAEQLKKEKEQHKTDCLHHTSIVVAFEVLFQFMSNPSMVDGLGIKHYFINLTRQHPTQDNTR